ncbi:MAG: YqeG family HAD IIIA-type phosphatase [Thermoguttaceae bacterium]|nr:YqeG family HAD IIIA-type phosphatase [Thermoguttaceae bacterium]
MTLLKIFQPDYAFEQVTDLTTQKLQEFGIVHLLLDVDCTLKSYRSPDVSPEVRQWLDELKKSGIGLCLVSNGRGRRISAFAKSLGIPFIASAMKPCARGCIKAMKTLSFDPKKTAMVGDQIFADIWAGHRAGIKAILITPIRPEEEPWFAQLKRPFEKIIFWLHGKR